MGFEDELHRMKQEYDDKLNSAGSIRVKMLSASADRVVESFQLQCLKEAKLGHAFCDMIYGCVPYSDEDVAKAKTIIKKNLKFIIDNNIDVPVDPRTEKLTTDFILPREKKFFEERLRESFAAAGIENGVIRVVAVYKTVNRKIEKGIFIKRFRVESRQVIDHEAFCISLSW